MTDPIRETSLQGDDSNAQLRQLLDGIKELAIFRLDPEGRVSTWNAGAEHLKGYSASEIIGRHFSCLYPRDAIDAGRPAQALAVAAREGRFEEEGWRVRKDGTAFWAHVSITAIRGPGSELLGFGKVTRDLTEQHRLTQEAQALQERFARAVSGTGNGLFEGGDVSNGAVVWVSPRWWAMLGYNPAEMPETIAGEGIAEMIHPEDRDAVAAARLSAAVSVAPFSMEHRIRTRQGAWLWVHVRSTIERDTSGRVVRISGAMEDISARKEAERRLKQANERFSIASKAAGLGFWDVDVETNTVYWDDQNFTLYGHSRKDGGQPSTLWVNSLHPDDRARVEQEIADALRGMRPFDTTFRIIWPSGEIRHLKAAGTVTRDAHGTPIQMFGINFDITETVRLTADLALARADLQAILDNVPARISSWNADNTNRFINRSAEEQYGMTSAQAFGRAAREIVGASRFREAERFVQAALDGERQSRDAIDRRPDGSLRYSQVTYVPNIVDSEVRGLYVLAIDVTELRNSYERIRDLVQRLESIRELERRNLALMLHEGIAQDLAAAKMGLDRMQPHVTSDRDIERLCQDLSQSLRQYIEELRRGANELRPWMLAHLTVSDAIQEHARQFAGLSGLEINITAQATLPVVDEVTRLLIFRAAQETLTNAARHAQARSVAISLHLDDGALAMDVTDDGIGIPDGAVDKPGSFGLLGIRERFGAVGGGMTIQRLFPSGTRVSVQCPFVSSGN